MQRRLRRNEQKCKRKTGERSVLWKPRTDSIKKNGLITMLNVLELSKRMKIEKCPLSV